MDYTLRLDEGEVVDSSEDREPLQFIAGQGQIIPGLEEELYGMEVGDEKHVVVPPEKGYGEFDADLFETLPRNIFPEDMELEPGLGFRMRTRDGRMAIAYVHEVKDGEVVVNLNHPLAGKTLHFDVEIADLREATEEELAGCGGDCAGCGGSCGS
jgi:FKBP-type peptidyl-prolyl cis-trans isomerase SlyD